MPDRLVIESSRLRLSEFDLSDARDVYDCITPAVARYMFWDPPRSFEAYRARREAVLRSGDTSDLSFVIRRRDTRECLGIAGLDRVAAPSPELGVWLKETAHRQGYGSEAVRAVAEWACAALGKTRFTYPVATQNVPSRRIAESLGGKIVGTRTNPKYDSVVYEIPWNPTGRQRGRMSDGD